MATVEQAILAQATPSMLAAKARDLISREDIKGCEPTILTTPVALEPAYAPLTARPETIAGQNEPDFIYAPITNEEELIRFQIWISPEQSFNWKCCELFLKQLCLINHPVGMEIVGNEKKVFLRLLCHRADTVVVSTAFHGKFQQCKLSPLFHNGLSELVPAAWETIKFYDFYPSPPYSDRLTCPEELHASSYECLLVALANIPAPALGMYQVLLQPVAANHDWHFNIETLIDLEFATKLLSNVGVIQRYAQQSPSGDLQHMSGEVETKANNDKPIYAASARLMIVGDKSHGAEYLQSLAVFSSLFLHGGKPLNYLSETDYLSILSPTQIQRMFQLGLTHRPGFLVNSSELAGLFHIPPIHLAEKLDIALDTLEPLVVPEGKLTEGAPIGTCNVAGIERLVCIEEMLCHNRLIGKPKKGKSTVLENMIMDDIEKKKYGVALIDAHGDLAKRLLSLLPEEAVERTIFFEPGNQEWVPMWNPLHKVPGQDLGRIADDLVAALKSFITGWGDRMETMLRQAFFGLLHLSNSSFLDVADILRPQAGRQLRKLILENVDNIEARRFWQEDFKEYRAEARGPAKHKLSKLLVGGSVSLMFSQPLSYINFHRIMDERMIFLADLSKLGAEAKGAVGSLLLGCIHHTALDRSEFDPDSRREFHGYVDEAHRFVTDSLEDMIFETRKFGVGLTLAHQSLKQFTAKTEGGLSSAGTTVIFNVNSEDAGRLVKELEKKVTVDDIVALQDYEAFLRSGNVIARIKTLKPRDVPEKNYRDQIIAQSRAKYCKRASEVKRMLLRREERHYQTFVPLSSQGNSGRETQPLEELPYDEW